MLNKLGITAFERIVYALILLLISIVIYMYYNFPEQLWLAVQEDAILENLTILFLGICLIICINKAVKYLKQKKYGGLITFIFISLALIFVIGEELSWGQRIFNIQSGDYFLNNNTQAETNFHNLQFGDTRINKLIFTQVSTVLLSIYFLFSRLICKLNFFNYLRERLCVPLPKLHHTIVFYFAFLAVYAFNYKRNSEVMELIFPLIFMLIFLNPHIPKQKVSVKPTYN